MNSKARSACMDILGQQALGEGQYRVTIAANDKVRQPPDLDLDGMSTENYLKNPVVMWAHDGVGRSPSGGLPIGRTTRLTKTGDGHIVADFEFLADDAFAQRVKNAWDSGFLRAASISWLPLERVPNEDGGWQDTRSELLEWSIVSVPADPDALRESHRLMLDSLLTETVDEEQEVYLLARSDYEDLKTALGLLRLAVRGVRPEEPPLPEAAPDEGEEDADLAEIRAAVGAILSAAKGMGGWVGDGKDQAVT